MKELSEEENKLLLKLANELREEFISTFKYKLQCKNKFIMRDTTFVEAMTEYLGEELELTKENVEHYKTTEYSTLRIEEEGFLRGLKFALESIPDILSELKYTEED